MKVSEIFATSGGCGHGSDSGYVSYDGPTSGYYPDNGRWSYDYYKDYGRGGYGGYFNYGGYGYSRSHGERGVLG